MIGREESPDSTEHCTFEREDVREGIETEKKTTSRQKSAEGSPLLKLQRVKVRRWGKSSPGQMVTFAAVCLTGCKIMYIPALSDLVPG